MLSTNRLQSLSQLSPPMLTVYLYLRPAEASLHGLVPSYLAWLKAEGRSIANGLPPEEKKLFLKQLARTEEFLRNRTSHERSIVVFAGSAVWEIVPLQVEIKNELHWGKPALSQLLWLADEHQPYCLVVVDRAGARFFRYWLGEMAEFEEKKFQIDTSQWKKPELGHVARPGIKKTRGSQRDVFQHRMDAQYARLCRAMAKQAVTLCGKERLLAVFLVGSDRLIKPMEAAFPREFRDRLVLIEKDLARFASSDLQQHLEPRISDWEHKRASEHVTALLGSERGAVVGFDEALAQLQKGKVRTLAFTRDLDERLHQCVRCGWTDRSADPVCPVCGSERRGVTLRDVLPELARKNKAGVEVVTGEAGQTLKQAGGMAAWLRQPKQIRARRRR